MQPGRQGVDGQKGVNFQPTLAGDPKQLSLGGLTHESLFLVDEIPHFLNKSTDGITSVTILDDMPTFGCALVSFGWIIQLFVGYYHN